MRSIRIAVSVLVVASGVVAAPVVTNPNPEARALESVQPEVEQETLDLTTPESDEVIEADSDFSLVALTWDANLEADAKPIEVRVRDDAGGWSDWVTLDVAEDPVEPGTPEAELSRPATEALWVGSASAVEVRSEDGSAAGAPRLELIDPGVADQDDAIAVSGGGSLAAAAATQPAIVTRAQWGADESMRRCTPSVASSLKGAVVHHTVGTNTYSASDSAAIVRGIYAFHTQSRGWCDIGYNFLVDRFGTIFEGRYGGVDRAVIGAHVGGFNTGTTGVSMIGTFTDVRPPDVMLDSVARILAWKLDAWDIDPLGTVSLVSGGNSKYPQGSVATVSTVSGHRDLYATECPGNTGYTALPELRQRAANLTSTATTSAPLPSAPQSGPVGVARWYQRSDGDWVDVPQQGDQPSAAQLESFGYLGDGVPRFFVSLVRSADADEVAVYRWWHNRDKDWVDIVEGSYSDATLQAYGYTQKTFQYIAHRSPAAGRVAVHRWWSAADRDWVTLRQDEISDATLQAWGYTNKTLLVYAQGPGESTATVPSSGSSGGQQTTTAQAVLAKAGFTGAALDIALGVAYAESRGYADAVGDFWQIIPYHVVRSGESLSSIAQIYRTNWQSLATLNSIPGPNYVIYPGQKLWNPTYRQRFDDASGVQRYPSWDSGWVDPVGDPVWGPSVGMYQVRTLRNPSRYGGDSAVRDIDALRDPVEQARAAYTISKGGTDWTPWTVYRTGAYSAYRGVDFPLLTGHPEAERWNLAGLP